VPTFESFYDGDWTQLIVEVAVRASTPRAFAQSCIRAWRSSCAVRLREEQSQAAAATRDVCQQRMHGSVY
jgi:hypothetical protein